MVCDPPPEDVEGIFAEVIAHMSDAGPDCSGSPHRTPPGSTFVCFACARRFGPDHVNLDARDNVICGECWVADPPPVDVEGIFAEVTAHMSDGAERQQACAISAVCPDCGGTACNGWCANGC